MDCSLAKDTLVNVSCKSVKSGSDPDHHPDLDHNPESCKYFCYFLSNPKDGLTDRQTTIQLDQKHNIPGGSNKSV